MLHKSSFLNIGIWLILFFCLLILFGHQNIPLYWGLYHRGKCIDGHVVNKQELNHQSVDYLYIVNNVSYKENSQLNKWCRFS